VISDNILGIRLGMSTPRQIEDLASHVVALFSTLMSAGEVLQVRTAKERAQTITIDTGKLETSDFEPTQEALQVAISNGAKAILVYFTGSEGPINPVTTYPAEPA
jgi:hypothetical protein